MYAAIIRAAEHWRGIRVTEFENRRLKAIREELNAGFADRTRQQLPRQSPHPRPVYPARTGLDLAVGRAVLPKLLLGEYRALLRDTGIMYRK
jgi:hypothetical protein